MNSIIMTSIKVVGFVHSNLPLLIHIVTVWKELNKIEYRIGHIHLGLFHILGGQLKFLWEYAKDHSTLEKSNARRIVDLGISLKESSASFMN